MGYAACPGHDFPRQNCDDCRDRRPTYDPSANLTLRALKAAWPDRDDRDRPDYIADRIDADGTVYVRPVSLTDVLDWVERETRGDVS